MLSYRVYRVEEPSEGPNRFWTRLEALSLPRYTLRMSTLHRSHTRCSTGSSGSPPTSTMPDVASSVRFSLSIGWIVNRAKVPADASCEAFVKNEGFKKMVESTICSV